MGGHTSTSMNQPLDVSNTPLGEENHLLTGASVSSLSFDYQLGQ